LRESQQRLEDAKDRYSELYNFAPVGYSTLDPEGYIQEINLTASAMLETPRERLIGKSFRTVVGRTQPGSIRCAHEAMPGDGGARDQRSRR
jgi:PAS domain-containing protein